MPVKHSTSERKKLRSSCQLATTIADAVSGRLKTAGQKSDGLANFRWPNPPMDQSESVAARLQTLDQQKQRSMGQGAPMLVSARRRLDNGRRIPSASRYCGARNLAPDRPQSRSAKCRRGRRHGCIPVAATGRRPPPRSGGSLACIGNVEMDESRRRSLGCSGVRAKSVTGIA